MNDKKSNQTAPLAEDFECGEDSPKNRQQAFARLLPLVEGMVDPLSAPFDTRHDVGVAITDILAPFLANPERHREHVRTVVEFAAYASALRVLRPVLEICAKFPFSLLGVRRQLSRNLEADRTKFVSEVRDGQERLLTTIDPGPVDVDLLPLRSLVTDKDWSAQGMRLILLESRTAIYPSNNMELEAVSHRIEVLHPEKLQFVEVHPSSSVEDIGATEWTVSSKGRFVETRGRETGIGLKVSHGPLGVDASHKRTRSTTHELEASGSRKVERTEHIQKLVSSAIGRLAQWEMLRTPTQVLRGGNEFWATALVPAKAKEVVCQVEVLARIDGWGPETARKQVTLPIPAEQDSSGPASAHPF